jgi:RimJ/RimL family protein N-acetyltransferase
MKNIFKILQGTTFQKIIFESISLKQVNQDDEAYNQLLSSSGVLDFIHCVPSHSDIYYSASKLADYGLDTKSSSLIFLIEKNSTQKAIGFSIIHNIDLELMECEVSFYINPNHRRGRLPLNAFIALADFIYSEIGVDKLNIGTFEPKIIHYLRRLGLQINKPNHNRKTRLFSNETVDYFTCQLELKSFKNNPVLIQFCPKCSQKFRQNKRIENKITNLDLQNVHQEMFISNEKIRDFFTELKMNESKMVTTPP